MLLFTTTTVINNLKDFTTGKDLITNSSDKTAILIKRHNPFKVACIDKIYKAQHVDPVKDVVTITNLAELAEDRRVELYIRSVGNADPMYANSLVFKGKPLYIEVPAGTKATSTNAKEDTLVKIAQKYLNLVFGGEAQLVATVSGSNLVLTCVNPYQRITKAVVTYRGADTVDGFGAKVAGEFGEALSTTKTPAVATITTGTEGFGDYDHMIKDLRLPTGANLRWKRTMEDEMPIPGHFYDQYTLVYSVDRGVMGLGAVGMNAKSTTTHVFWVDASIAKDFESAISLASSKIMTVKSDLNTADDTHEQATASA